MSQSDKNLKYQRSVRRASIVSSYPLPAQFSIHRRSARLQEKQRLRGTSPKSEPVRQLPSPTSNSPGKQVGSSHVQLLVATSLIGFKVTASPDRKRKREYEHSERRQTAPFTDDQAEPDHKRHRIQSEARAISDTLQPDPISESTKGDINLNHWIKEGTWPSEYFQPDSSMNQSLTRKRSTPSIAAEQASTPSNSISVREGKNPAARSPRYEDLLRTAGIFMSRQPGVDLPTNDSKGLIRTLMDTEQDYLQDSLFNSDIFEDFCQWIADRNEASIVRDLTPLLVPSAELMYLRGSRHLRHVIEAVDESWSKCIPMVNGPCPKPDFSVGLRISAFTPEQQAKLGPFDGGWQYQSRLLATHRMYFPFLTAEAKCGQEGLIIADRQNANSASVAANAVVELYKTVSRHHELHRKILTFSISHNQETVNIYGHYALTTDKKISFHRYKVKQIPFADPDGIDKWRPYQFTKNVYDTFLPIHLERVCSAIDQLPDPEAFAPDPLSEPSTTGDPTQADGQAAGTSPATTPQTSAEPAFKKPKAGGS
ncbi:MAG: hypothetical protein LQ352_001699 [Teloschistes flavicans]|nr:MAG: hypothetical protein LQ352_001699 [Teloschistes flavicans]